MIIEAPGRMPNEFAASTLYMFDVCSSLREI